MTEPSAIAATPARTVSGTVLAGVVALAVAMGIGRFAFTPLLPLMLRDGLIDAATGAEWAAANYAGYLLGALSAARLGIGPLRLLRAGLVVVVATTPVMAVVEGPLAGALLRGAAGVASAWVLVGGSSWCLAELARRHAAALGGWIYTGVGLGIALTGLLTWLAGGLDSRHLWLALGALAALGTTVVLAAQRGATASAPTTPVHRARRADGSEGGHGSLVAAYGCFGFGYIVPATFLPAMAREQVADPLVFGITWPLFGFAAALSVALAAHRLSHLPRRHLWAVAQATMALGTALPLLSHALWSLATSAVLVGGTFMGATMAGLQLARERVPLDPIPLLARMTSAFAAGQIAGPLAVRALGAAGLAGPEALAAAGALATLLLAGSAAWLWRGRPATAPR